MILAHILPCNVEAQILQYLGLAGPLLAAAVYGAWHWIRAKIG